MTVDTLGPRRLWHIAALCLAVALLAACAGRPDFATLDTRVVPEAPLEAGDDAALRVALESLDAQPTADHDSFVPVAIAHPGTEGRAEAADQWLLERLDDRHGEAALPATRRHLHPDEAGPDDQYL